MESFYKGSVKWFDDGKGFGFLTSDDGLDVFVHYTGIISDQKRKTLIEGERVTFSLIDTPKGKQATGVVVVD